MPEAKAIVPPPRWCLNCKARVADVEAEFCRMCEHMHEAPLPELAAGVLGNVEDEDEYKPLYDETDDDADLDVQGDGPREDDEPTKAPVVFEPLPPGAGVLPQGRSVYQGHGKPWLIVPGPPERQKPAEPEPDAFTMKIREYLASLPAKGLQT